MKVLVTGANGFIARNIIEALAGRYELTACNSQELNLLDQGEVEARLRGGRFDVVLHTATYDAAPKGSTKDPAKVMENNLRMFFNLARAKNHFGKMLYLGSGAEFGRDHWAPKMSEKSFDRYVPADQYGFSKYIMNKYARQTSHVHNLRVFSVFGKYEDWRYRFISRACCCALLGLPIVIRQNVVFDFMSVEDLARTVDWFIAHEPKHPDYNVCSGQARSFADLAELVVTISGRKVPVVIKTDGLGQEYSGDNSRLLEELQGFRFTPLKESVQALYDWYAAHQNLIKREELA